MKNTINRIKVSRKKITLPTSYGKESFHYVSVLLFYREGNKTKEWTDARQYIITVVPKEMLQAFGNDRSLGNSVVYAITIEEWEYNTRAILEENGLELVRKNLMGGTYLDFQGEFFFETIYTPILDLKSYLFSIGKTLADISINPDRVWIN